MISHFDERIEMLLEAVKDIGRPYIYGGDDPEVGPDCSGFVQACLRKIPGLYDSVDRNAAGIYDYYSAKGCEIQLEDICPGCVVFFLRSNGIGHVGIYTHDASFISGAGKELIDAGGGGSLTRTRDQARMQDAAVRIVSLFRSNPYKIVDPFKVLDIV